MDISNLMANVGKTLKSNAPEILTGLSIAGVAITSYLSAKGSTKATIKIIEKEENIGFSDNPRERFLDRTKLVWKEYIPAAISGGLTIVCIAGSAKTTGKRTAAAVAAYSVTEKAFSEYKEKVVEEIGKGKERKIRDEVAQDSVTTNTSKEVVIFAGGDVLCCELYTKRYFRCDMETLRRAENNINARINNQMYVALDEFYDMIGLPVTSHSSGVGWDSDKLLDLEFSSVLTEDKQPCLAFNYNYVKPLW